jgi:magnesium chelatase family protein
LSFPAEVLLIAAMNPCPCGNFRDDSSAAAGHQVCLCSFDQIQRYRARVSGPLLDRIDLHVSVPAVPYRDFVAHTSAESSVTIRERVVAARARQQKRLGAGRTNAMMCESELRRDVTLDAGGQSMIERAIDTCGLSTRGINRVLKMSRTLADLAGATRVEHSHVREALAYRNLAQEPAGIPCS